MVPPGRSAPLPISQRLKPFCCSAGDPTAAPSPVPKRVGLPQVSRVLSEVFGDRMAAGSPGAGDAFPLQQKVLVCSLLLLTRHLRTRQVTLGKVSGGRDLRVPSVLWALHNLHHP